LLNENLKLFKIIPNEKMLLDAPRERFGHLLCLFSIVTGFCKTLKFIIHKYTKLLLYFVEGCLLFLIQTSEATYVHVTCLSLKYHDTCTCKYFISSASTYNSIFLCGRVYITKLSN
jgi:hypothetical protein